MKTKAVLLTFDYELFLGKRSGTVRDCMIDPTRRVMDLLKDFGLTAIFFVDTVYLTRLRKIAGQYGVAAEDWAMLQQQLKALVKGGHYIFPHIHPHWLDAGYLPKENEWTLGNYRYYQFSSLPEAQQRLLFDDSIELIRSLAGQVAADYRVDAYRAGGWSIQPFQHFRPHFLRHGILHEWSVIPGRYQLSDAHQFDFRDAPAWKPVYRFDKDVCLEKKDGPFTEWTISCLPMNPLERWLDFKISGLMQRMGRKEKLKGSTVDSRTQEEGDLREDNRTKRILASFEALNPLRVRKYRSAIRNADYFQFISHPKMLTTYDLKLMERLLRAIQQDDAIETDFRKCSFKTNDLI